MSALSTNSLHADRSRRTSPDPMNQQPGNLIYRLLDNPCYSQHVIHSVDDPRHRGSESRCPTVTNHRPLSVTTPTATTTTTDSTPDQNDTNAPPTTTLITTTYSGADFVSA
ncbi:hypothetical protein SprV_0401526200 [Sparganum proliferum]